MAACPSFLTLLSQKTYTCKALHPCPRPAPLPPPCTPCSPVLPVQCSPVLPVQCPLLLVIMIVGLFIDQIQGHKHVERVERKRAQSTGYAKDARIFKSRRRATWLDTYRQGSSAGSWLPRRTDSEITGIQRPAFQQTHSRGCQWHKPRERAPPERA